MAQCKPVAKTVTAKDIMFVWAITDIEDGGGGSLANFSKAGPLERAELLGVPNVTMCGQGLPLDYTLSERLTKHVASVPRLVWEIASDDAGGNSHGDFKYTQKMKIVRKLADQFPNFEGIMLDDMTTVSVDQGFKPEHIAALKKLMPGSYNQQVKLWGVVYTMNLDDSRKMNRLEKLVPYIDQLDVINLWVWHGSDIPKIPAYVDICRNRFPDKPIVLGLYMYNYGEGKQMSQELMQQQCEIALKLAKQGKIRGIVFLTINDDGGLIKWTADWIKKVGGTRLPVITGSLK